MRNLYQAFQNLLPRDRLQAGTVIDHNADGTSTVTLPDGGLLRVTGQSVAVGKKAFIQSGRIQGEAPDLPLTEITV